MFNKYTIIFTLFLVALCLYGSVSFAVEIDIPEGQPITFDTLSDIINSIARFLMFAGVVLSVIFLTWAGISYVMAGANPTKVTEAKQKLKAGIIGALIVFGIGTIIATIQAIGSGNLYNVFGG